MKDYKKILEGVVNIISTTEKSDIGFANICSYIGENCPELKESKDERIRKAIHIYLDWLDGRRDYQPKGDYTIKDMIAWLEKQGEQKPTWSEEDERMFDYALDMIEWYSGKNEDKSRLVSNWLKSIKDKVQLKQEWSGGDEAHLHSLITHLEQWIERHPNTTGADIQGENIAWLKSLRPQSQWKPSDEQMEVLKEATSIVGSKYKSCLNSLYSDLKKLKD